MFSNLVQHDAVNKASLLHKARRRSRGVQNLSPFRAVVEDVQAATIRAWTGG